MRWDSSQKLWGFLAQNAAQWCWRSTKHSRISYDTVTVERRDTRFVPRSAEFKLPWGGDSEKRLRSCLKTVARKWMAQSYAGDLLKNCGRAAWGFISSMNVWMR